jgi:RNA polymerase sigma-70 factor (ECF subfamily)
VNGTSFDIADQDASQSIGLGSVTGWRGAEPKGSGPPDRGCESERGAARTVDISDESLCERVARRDDAAFELLVSRYQQRAYRLAWSILRHAEDARDLSQEAFMRVWDAAASFRGQARFSTWFYRILVNLCLDHRRRHRWWRFGFGSSDEERSDTLAERLADPGPLPGAELGKEEMMQRVWAAVDRLAPQQRAAIVLQVQEGMSTPEIATVLRCSEATVRVHLHRAVGALRKSMGTVAPEGRRG